MAFSSSSNITTSQQQLNVPHFQTSLQIINMRFLPIFASSVAFVAASPFPEPTGEVEKRTTSCSTKDNLAYKVVSAQGAKGSIFCNDYLHLPTVTKHTTLPEKTT
jgi:hypothetical protein